MTWDNPSKKTREKEALQCPKECFLMPNELKFPICEPDCKLSCSGLHAAYVRAREWKYNSVSLHAMQLMEHKCGWHPKLLGGSIENVRRTHRWAKRGIYSSS
jgi:hypothetical protein